MLFPPRDLLFPKLFGTESPEDVTGEKRPLSVLAFSAQHTFKDSFLPSFIPQLSGFALCGFGTCSQSLASAWECWGHRHVVLSSSAAVYCVSLRGWRACPSSKSDTALVTCVTEDPSLICKVQVLVLHFLYCSQQGHTLDP